MKTDEANRLTDPQNLYMYMSGFKAFNLNKSDLLKLKGSEQNQGYVNFSAICVWGTIGQKKLRAMCLPQHIMKITKFNKISGHFVQDKIKAMSTIFVLWYPKLK